MERADACYVAPYTQDDLTRTPRGEPNNTERSARWIPKHEPLIQALCID